MRTHRHDDTAIADNGRVWLQQIDRGHWRVLDGRLDSEDARALLGFIDRHGMSLHATRVQALDESRSCSSLDEARELFTSEIEVSRPGRLTWAAVARRLHVG